MIRSPLCRTVLYIYEFAGKLKEAARCRKQNSVPLTPNRLPLKKEFAKPCVSH